MGTEYGRQANVVGAGGHTDGVESRATKEDTRGFSRSQPKVDYEPSGDLICFSVRLGDKTWSPTISIDEGHVFCDCPDFFYRKGLKEQIRLGEIRHQCKHIKLAIGALMRDGYITKEHLK